jgi:hypothetical protein
MKMFLDDVRDAKVTYPNESMITVRSYEDAVTWIKENGVPSVISFDHDLGDGCTGFDFAKWIVERDIDENSAFIPLDFTYMVHSANPIGRDNICGLLDN